MSIELISASTSLLINEDSIKRHNVNSWKFPGGEIGVRLVDETASDETYIISLTNIVTSDDIMSLANICNALKHNCVPRSQIIVYMPYFSYARQDRVCHTGESFALETFIQLLDAMYFHKLIVLDLHSNVAKKLLNQSTKIIEEKQQHEIMKNLPKHDWYVAPDTGATNKIFKHSGITRENLITMNKSRTDAGIVHDTVSNQLNFNDFKGTAVVIDDICDGGATFISVAQSLKKLNPNISLNLAITHGIFSKGLEELSQYYDSIYVVNLMNDNIPSTKIIGLK